MTMNENMVTCAGTLGATPRQVLTRIRMAKEENETTAGVVREGESWIAVLVFGVVL